ncbi:MAG: hypothetical protein ACM36C_01840 [Acidobacteriota bacterium]
MRNLVGLVLAVVISAATSPLALAQAPTEELRDLRSRIEAKYEVVPLSDGLALRPKVRIPDVRLIEIAEGGIIVDGTPVTGRELRSRIGADTDMILRLSYLDDATRRALFSHDAADTTSREPEESQPAPSAPEPPEAPKIPRAHTSHGDRVRIFGNVTVDRDEDIRGQAVAVIGSAHIDGEVGDQVVAVLGSVYLGPNAVVGGDVVSVGGHVYRESGSQVRGGITEVALGRGVNADLSGFGPRWTPFGFMFGPFGGVARLIGSTFHFLVLALLAGIALLIARVTVERSADRVAQEPVKATLVGIVAQLLLLPAFVLVAILLAITIVGIPLLLLLPFAALFLVLLAIVGFSGTALTIGRLARHRFSWSVDAPFVNLVTGVLVIMLPLLVGRVVGLAGWAVSPLVFLLVAIGLCIEFLAWASGFGAVLVNLFTRWQARRTPPPTPPVPESATV